MIKMTRFAPRSAIAAVAAGALALAVPAAATTLTSKLSVDNGYIAYISTSDIVAGTEFSRAEDWGSTATGTANLAAGVSYYLHIYAYDSNVAWNDSAAMLGQFNLDGNKHKFANGGFMLTTNATYWKGNNTSFGSAYGSVTDIGPDGMGPWGDRPQIANTARWIWAGNAMTNEVAFFTTKITAVPEPGSIALFGLGLAGLAALRRKKQAR